jgi:hypothetical protein
MWGYIKIRMFDLLEVRSPLNTTGCNTNILYSCHIYVPNAIKHMSGYNRGLYEFYTNMLTFSPPGYEKSPVTDI